MYLYVLELFLREAPELFFLQKNNYLQIIYFTKIHTAVMSKKEKVNVDHTPQTRIILILNRFYAGKLLLLLKLDEK